MKNGLIVKATLATCVVLTAALLLQQDFAVPSADPLDEAIAREELRVQAAHASLDARPLIGESHLAAFDAQGAIEREESTLRRLSSMRRASR
jgi:hypothetical protein